MIENDFINRYLSKIHIITEGYAYAISSDWYTLMK